MFQAKHQISLLLTITLGLFAFYASWASAVVLIVTFALFAYGIFLERRKLDDAEKIEARLKKLEEQLNSLKLRDSF